MPYPQSLDIAGVPLARWDAERDLGGLLVMAQDEQIGRWIGLSRDEEALAATSARYAAHWEDYGFGLWAARPPDGAGAGWLGACHPRWHPEFEAQVELAWSLTPGLRGRGLVTRAARAAAEACFSELGLEQVLAFVAPENTASASVAARIGMRPTGETSDPRDGEVLQVFSMRADDLLAGSRER